MCRLLGFLYFFDLFFLKCLCFVGCFKANMRDFANIPSAIHLPSCVALNEAAAKKNSRGELRLLPVVTLLLLLLTWDLGM